VTDNYWGDGKSQNPIFMGNQSNQIIIKVYISFTSLFTYKKSSEKEQDDQRPTKGKE